MFGRARKLILTENETSIYFQDFECNRTNNSNAKYQLNLKITTPKYGCSRAPVWFKTLWFSITLLAGRSLLYVEPAVNRQPGFRRELVEQVDFLKIFLPATFRFFKFPH